MIYYYTDNKKFLVDSWDEGKRFFAFINREYGITSVEYCRGSYPNTTVCEWKSEADFIAGITWYDWILAGVKNKKLKNKIRRKNR